MDCKAVNERVLSTCMSNGQEFAFIVSEKIHSRLRTIKPMLMWQWQGWILQSMREYKPSIEKHWFLYEAMFNPDGSTSLYITYRRQQNTLESQMHFHTHIHQVTIICSASQDFYFFMSMPHRWQVWACNDPIYLSCHRNCTLWPKIQAPQLSSLSNHETYWHHCQCILWITIHQGTSEIINMHYISFGGHRSYATAHGSECMLVSMHSFTRGFPQGFSGFFSSKDESFIYSLKKASSCMKILPVTAAVIYLRNPTYAP